MTENLQATGNVYLAGAKPSTHESEPLLPEDFEPGMKLEEKSDGWWFEMSVNPDWRSQQRRAVVTTGLLGKATIPDAPFEQPDGTPYRLDTDYFGETRSADNPSPGPFRLTDKKQIHLKVWPKK